MTKFHTITLTPSVNADAHAAGDVIAALEEVPDFALEPGGSVRIKSVVLTDASDTGAAVDLVFYTATGTIGAESAAYTTTDAVGATLAGTVNVLAASYDDAVNNKTATQAEDLIIGCAGGTTSIWMGIVARGSVTPGGTGVFTVKLGLER